MAERRVILDYEGQEWTIVFIPTVNLLQVTGSVSIGFHPGMYDDFEYDDYQRYVISCYSDRSEGRLRAELTMLDEQAEYSLLVELIVRLVYQRPLLTDYQVVEGRFHAWQGYDVAFTETTDVIRAIEDVSGFTYSTYV